MITQLLRVLWNPHESGWIPLSSHFGNKSVYQGNAYLLQATLQRNLNKYLRFWNWYQFSGGFRGPQGCATPSRVRFSLFSCSFWKKKILGQIIGWRPPPPFGVGAFTPTPTSPYGKYWFSHCSWRFPSDHFSYFLSVPARKLFEGK